MHTVGEYLTESKILGSNGKNAKKLTVKLWAKGVVDKNTIFDGSEHTQYYIRKSGQLMYGKLDFLNCAFGIVPPELDSYESTLDSPAFDISNINSNFILNRIIQKNFYKKNGDIANGSRKAKRIHPDVFLAMELYVPSIYEQNKISCLLELIDKKIRLQHQLIENLKLYKRGVLKYIFSQIKQYKKLYEICIYQASNNTYSSISKNNGDYPVYDAAGITTYIDQFDIDKNYISIIKDGAGVGRLQFCQSNSSIIGTMGAIIPKKCDSYYLYYSLQTVDFRKYIIGSTIPHIYFKDYSNVNIPFVDKIEQKKISIVLCKIDQQIINSSSILILMNQLKSGLLQQLLI